MRRRLLGATGYEISVLGMGAWQIGGRGGDFAWHDQDEAVSVGAVHAALERGVNWIDTAPAYGCGRSETIVGRAIAGLAFKPLIFTKCGCVWDSRGNLAFDLSSTSLRREVEASRLRLGVDAIDLLQLHWPVPDEQLEEAWETLVQLRREGSVRAIGVSNVTTAHLDRLRPIASVEVIQLGYSLLDRRAESSLLPYARRHQSAVLAYSPLQSGLLSGTMTYRRLANLPDDDWRLRDPQFREPHVSEYLAFVECLRPLASSLGMSVAELAIAWVLRDRTVSGAIVGISRPDQVAGLLGASGVDLDASALDQISRCFERSITRDRPADRFVPPGVAS